MSRFNDRVAGIPCQVEVVYYEPYDPGVTSGPPEHCYPPEGGDFEVELYDRKGYRARWLEAKLTADELDRLREAFEARLEDERAEAQIAAYEARQDPGAW